MTLRAAAGGILLAGVLAAAGAIGGTAAKAAGAKARAGDGAPACWTETTYEYDYQDDAGSATPAGAMSTLRCSAARDVRAHAARAGTDRVAPPGYDAAVANARQEALELLHREASLRAPDAPADGDAATWTAHDSEGRLAAELVMTYRRGAWYPALERYRMPEAVCDLIQRWQGGEA